MIDTMISAYSLSQSECAKRLGKSQGYIANKLRLLKFSDNIRSLILKSGLTERHARLLLRLRDEGQIAECIEKISSMRLTVATSEALIDGMLCKRDDNEASSYSPRREICEFEELVFKRVREMRRLGIRADAKMSEDKHKKYITIVIENTE